MMEKNKYGKGMFFSTVLGALLAASTLQAGAATSEKNLQDSLAEIARAGQKYQEYRLAGQLDLAEAVHRYAQSIRKAAGIDGDGRSVTGLEGKNYQSDRHSQQNLDKGKWASNTYKAVQQLIDKHGINSASYDHKKKPYAIFDWDNTSIMNDTEEALFIYQIDHLAFKMTPEVFSQVIKTNVPEGPFAEDYKNDAGQLVTLEAISKDLSRDYEYLYNHYKGLKGNLSLEEIRETDQFKDFKAKLFFLYEAIGDTHGTDIGYPWVLYMFSNMTVEEVQELAEKSNDHGLGDNISKVTLSSPKSLAGEAGMVSVSYTSGLRLTPEISNLMNTLRNNGIDVYVVSASMEEVVEVFATYPKYGYNLSKEDVIGMRLEKMDGKIQPVYQKNWPFTVKKGKTEIIQQEIASKRGYGPIFIAGDSNGDYDMMVDFYDMELGLVVNRVSGGNIGKLAAIASSELEKENPKYVLQGRDEHTGQWIPSESTLKLGKAEKALIMKP